MSANLCDVDRLTKINGPSAAELRKPYQQRSLADIRRDLEQQQKQAVKNLTEEINARPGRS